MNDTYIDPDNEDATLTEHLKLLHGVEVSNSFNHFYSFTVLRLSPMTWRLVSKDGLTIYQLLDKVIYGGKSEPHLLPVGNKTRPQEKPSQVEQGCILWLEVFGLHWIRHFIM